MTEKLEAGTAAPAFTLEDQDGASVSLSDLRGQKVILYFYPEAMTEGCTKQACDFRDNLNSLKSSGYTVVGISRDAPAKLTEFRERDGLNFELLSDPDRVVHEAYGVWGEKQLYGKTVVGVIRSTFVLDEQGVITLALYNVKATGHVAMLRKKLGLE
ncbi:thioredoxin-dependent thiol peroxidase [Leifsonia sp. H3M29-4]|uniref:thioredoxin-dependent thiol peroxidase n=1 Tax=Salinibacterium metalliresistens TaxID=3031321 RepID=UPI0023DAE3E9|nr:thioredoxin-dependent thiol peroxidase [Salinibacterium metalliresistens]MDF1479213.1 thioredoxin-dependent thiol peroxidase [Salinibacterium metalliresistens]